MILRLSKQMNNCHSHLQTFNNICPSSLHTEYKLMQKDQYPGVMLKIKDECSDSATHWNQTPVSGFPSPPQPILVAWLPSSAKGHRADKPQEGCEADPLPRMEICLKTWKPLLKKKKTADKYCKVWKWWLDQFWSLLCLCTHTYVYTQKFNGKVFSLKQKNFDNNDSLYYLTDYTKGRNTSPFLLVSRNCPQPTISTIWVVKCQKRRNAHLCKIPYPKKTLYSD